MFQAATELPCVWSPLGAAALAEKLEESARRGLLPGLGNTSTEGFEITDFGHPFESRLIGRIDPAEPGEPVGCRLRFRLEMKTRMLWVFVAVWCLTIWPGVWITHSMLRVYFPSYGASGGFWYPTWLWYLPLTVPFAPISIRSAIRKSRMSGGTEAVVLIGKVASAVGGNTEPRT